MSPLISSPSRGITYSTAGDGGTEIPFAAVTDADSRVVYWFVDDQLVGTSLSGESFMWKARPGSFLVRAIDQQGRAVAEQLKVLAAVDWRLPSASATASAAVSMMLARSGFYRESELEYCFVYAPKIKTDPADLKKILSSRDGHRIEAVCRVPEQAMMWSRASAPSPQVLSPLLRFPAAVCQ